MNARGYGSIPRELCHGIRFLCGALLPRSIATFIGLLIGAMLTPTGFVSDAYWLVNVRNHWSSYCCKWLQKGKLSWEEQQLLGDSPQWFFFFGGRH
jgi:hypothetical protein